MYNSTAYVISVDTITPITANRGTYGNYRPIACGSSNGLSIEFESISLRNKCDGGWDKTESGYGSWNFDFEGFAVAIKNTDLLIKSNFQEIATLAIEKRKFWAKIADVDSNIVREGLVRIGSYKETANLETAYGFTSQFIGVGKPIFEAVPLPPTPGTLTGYFGYLSDGQTLDYAMLTSGTPFGFENLGDLTIPYYTTEYRRLWFAIPTGQPIKNQYEDLGTGYSAPIGSPDDLIGTPVTISDFDAYIGNYETIYTDTIAPFGLKFKTV